MWPRISTRSAVGDALGGWPPPVLDPAGPYADPLAMLSWVLFAIAALVLLVVVAALWVALFGSARRKGRLGGTRAIWIGGVAFPAVVLSALLVWGLSLTGSLTAPIRGDEMRVKVTGEMWWWRIAYLGRDGQAVLHDANELHIPVGQPVVLELESADVIHSFWVPRLSGKLDMIPGRTNMMRIQADEPGVFGGQCAEYCGGPHALMGFVVVAHEPEDFARLMAARTAGARPPLPAHPDLARGAQLFQTAGCAACHRIAGTGANGIAGPDLSFLGTRQTLGAGILPNNRGTLMGWIGNSQAIKPGNRMPPYSMLSSDDLRALAVYLEAQR
ncbi:cytochrome c oxidase subunit II [Sphingosinicella sp. YJ22]|uniref:cytochrome c oxidase subunit II n=1 Tax=Sphingosinicella sp. YJ22 TaxID=1104780 RepID=UPI00140CDB9B|nr:cytochrome c oxidase subunit II [Sphingosinicella sp. YJ22]